MAIDRTIPLGKAEWIKFFGALYGLDQANSIFSEIEKNNTTLL
jgi:iron complex transport system substrate-binding protein